MLITDYVGTYVVRQGSTAKAEPHIEAGDTIYVGTGTHNATPPSTNGALETIGMTIWRNGAQVFPATGTGVMTFIENSVMWRGQVGTTTNRVQFTVALINDGGFATWKALYGAVIQVDPQVVGAWGADDRP